MQSTLIILLLTIVLSNPEILTASAQHPICIIGGGLSGLTLAIRLQEKGYRVNLFEKEGRFGGKMDTYKNEREGLLLEKGPMFFSPLKTYTSTYAKKYNMTIIPYDVHDQALYNPEIGSILGRYTMNKKQRAKLVELSTKYASYYNHSELEEVGYPNIDPNSDYSKPFSVWLKERGLSPLEPIFYFLVTLTGYGDLKETPALYVLKYVYPEGLIPILDAAKPFSTVAEGLGVLAERMATSVNSKFPRHELIQLVRKNGKQEVTFAVSGKVERTYTCEKTVITFIPLLSNIIPVVRDLTVEERSVLEMIKVNKYASSGHVIPSMRQWIYLGFVPKSIAPTGENVLPLLKYPKGHGEVIVFGKAGKGKNPQGYLAYSWLAGDYDSEGTERDERMMKRKLAKTVKKIHPFSETYFFKSYQYFPHVTGSSIQEGFYQRLENMQGNGGLYYACPILTFDYMHSTIEMGEKFADKFF